MGSVRKLGRGGQFEFEFTFAGRWSSGESRETREARFEAELQECCEKNPEFAAYVKKYHRGYGKGIHLGRCA